MKWISIKDGLPTDKDDDKFFVFVRWLGPYQGFLSSGILTWQECKDFREFELKHKYTHYIKIPKIPKVK